MGWFPCCCRRGGGDDPCRNCNYDGFFPAEAFITAPGEFFVELIGAQCFNLGTIEYVARVLSPTSIVSCPSIYNELFEDIEGGAYSSCSRWCLLLSSAGSAGGGLDCGECGWILKLEADSETQKCRFRAVMHATRLRGDGSPIVFAWAAHTYVTDWFVGPYDTALTYTLRWDHSVMGGFAPFILQANQNDLELHFGPGV